MHGVALLKEANLPNDIQWGFTEIYTNPPSRLLSDQRTQSAYYIMVKNGRVKGRDGAPEERLALPGFHVKIQWAAIANQSASKYGLAGQAQRSQEERVMFQQIEEFVGRKNPLGLGGGAKAVWPTEIGSALSKNSESGGGLHNIAASLQ